MFLAIDNGDKGEPWQKQAGTQLIKMHSKVLEIILMQDNSDCNFEKVLSKASMAHPTKMQNNDTIDNIFIWVMVVM